VGHFVGVRGEGDALEALAGDLKLFGPAGGEPEWLVGGVWLCTASAHFLATSSIEVLPDGQVARPLNIGTAEDLVEAIEADLPDVNGRLVARGSDLRLDEVPPPRAPGSLQRWPAEPYSTSVLVRSSQRGSDFNRVACGLLFRSEARRTLLVGTDVSSLAMVLSEDAELIERYCAGCDALSVADYLELGS
jgi:hypothetical protein